VNSFGNNIHDKFYHAKGEIMETPIKFAAKFIITLFLSAFLISSNCYSFQNEPDGFRGIKWGTDITTLKGMEFLSIDPSIGGIKKYKKTNEELKLGGATLRSVEYSFWREKFCSITVETEGSVNWGGLRDACIEKFGKGLQTNEVNNKFIWLGNIAEIRLDYHESSKKGSLNILSKNFKDQMLSADKQKAKDGAATGF